MKNTEVIEQLAKDIDRVLREAHITTNIRRDVAALCGEAHGLVKNLTDVGKATNAWGRE